MRHPRLVVTGLLVIGLFWLVFLPTFGRARPPERPTHFLADALQGLQDVLDDFHQEINPDAMAYVLVAPTKQPPGDLDGFPAEGRLIGVISTSHPLARFGLRRPGVYAIRLHQTADGTWQAAFLNAVGLASSVFAVEVKSSSKTYPQPQAFFTFYTRGIVICWQRTCVEI